MSSFPSAMSALMTGLSLAAGLCLWRPRQAPIIGAAAALATTLLIAWLWHRGAAPGIDLPWLPLTGSRLVLALDPLGAPMALFSAALASVTLLYTGAYLPHHLAEQGRPIQAQGRFCALMLAFMLAMLLLALARDLLILFVALELTALISFLLIGFDEDHPEARRAALLALVVTAGSALLFLIGVLLVRATAGTTGIDALGSEGREIPALAAGCLIAGVLAKSAQMPLHVWLPRAMVAPTPVSAYLHSAALVAAGVFVLLRLRPLLADTPELLAPLVWIGFTSALVGGLLALCADELKRILAYSTIAQYGHVLILIGLGGQALVAAALFIFAHGLCKAALFLTAGAVTATTGAERLSQARGHWRGRPLLAGASAVAAAGLIGLPATVGYFKEEHFFAAALEAGQATPWLAGAAAALTLAYIGRFWLGLFWGKADREHTRAVAPGLSLPVALLAAIVLLTGLLPQPLEPVFAAAGTAAASAPLHAELVYRLTPRPELWLTLAVWGGGLTLLLARRLYVERLAKGLARLAGWLGPTAMAERLTRVFWAWSDRMHDLEVRDLRDRIAAVLLPGAALVGLAILASDRAPPAVGTLEWRQAPLVAALLVTAASGLLVANARRHADMILLLSFVGFALALVFAIAHAPEVALVVVIMETLFSLLIVTLFIRIPEPRFATPERNGAPRRQGIWTAVIAGASAGAVAWYALGEPHSDEIPRALVHFTEQAHAGDVVSAIVADFRGLDTLVEISILTVAVLGALSIARGRAW